MICWLLSFVLAACSAATWPDSLLLLGREQLQPYSSDVRGGAVGSLAARSSAAWPLLAHPLVLRLCDAVLGKQRLLLTQRQLQGVLARQGQSQDQGQQRGSLPYQMHLNVTIPKQSGSGRQGLHRDGDLSLLDVAALGGLDHAVSCIWALDGDFTEERGTTRVRG